MSNSKNWYSVFIFKTVLNTILIYHRVNRRAVLAIRNYFGRS